MPPKKTTTTAIKDNNQNQLIHEQYFDLTQKYKDLYGTDIILLLQVGSFFEVYGDKHSKTGIIDKTKSNIEAFKHACNMTISEKPVQTPTGVLVMAGFRDYSLDKYLEKITDAGMTAVVYVQKKDPANGGKFIREYDGTYSPGTFVSYDTDTTAQLSNNLMCIWLDTYPSKTQTNPNMVCGMANAHIFTGKSTLFEYETPFWMNPTTFDELERYVSILAPSEAIFITTTVRKEHIAKIQQYIGLRCPVHVYSTAEDQMNDAKNGCKHAVEIENCAKQIYMDQILSKHFGKTAFQTCQEFQMYPLATQAYCFLLDFIQKHNPDMVRKIEMPVFKNTSTRMLLANHTLKQLNIIEDGQEDGKKMGKYSSVSALLNKCCTPMGRRKYQMQMTAPVFDEAWLQREYDMTEEFIRDFF
jgi:DNA mismatch repair protein MutS